MLSMRYWIYKIPFEDENFQFDSVRIEIYVRVNGKKLATRYPL